MSAQKKILVVDDSIIDRRMLGKIFQDDYVVYQAANGKEALDVLQESGKDIQAIILDLHMPIMDGFVFLRHKKYDFTIKDIPVLVSTEEGDQEAEAKALELVATEFLNKPYNAAVIKQRIANIVALRENASSIKKLERDVLTGIYNNTFFISKVKEILRDNPDKRYDIIATDIQDFKVVNDIYGSKTGDRLLRHVGNVMARGQIIRNETCGRWDADSFIALVKQGDYTEKTFADFNEAVNQFGIDMDIVVHFGIFHINDNNGSVENMCEGATIAVEQLKTTYGSIVAAYNEEMRKKLVRQNKINNNMNKALQNKEFKPYFQPKVNMQNGKVVGAEALVRWIDPTEGVISPGEFIPIFEKNGFITVLDKYVWSETCSCMRKWLDAGLPPFAISFNVSRQDLYDEGLADFFKDLIAKNKLNPKYLHLEITETAYTKNSDQILRVVRVLKQAGFIIEMDDFGKGYSSLTMLTALPIDVLKLDMQFLISDNNGTRQILSFIISLAKWLGVGIIAEGVETKWQRDRLLSLDCTYGQGYYYAAPMAETAFLDFVKKNGIDDKDITQSTNNAVTPIPIVTPKKVSSNKKVMLIVDDMQINRLTLIHIFKDNYNIVEAKNGQEACDYLAEHGNEVEIVLLDIIMPVMDGFETLKNIRNNPKLKNLPVVISSQADNYAESKAIKYGANDFISKPYNPEVCRRRIANVVIASKVNSSN